MVPERVGSSAVSRIYPVVILFASVLNTPRFRWFIEIVGMVGIEGVCGSGDSMGIFPAVNFLA